MMRRYKRIKYLKRHNKKVQANLKRQKAKRKIIKKRLRERRIQNRRLRKNEYLLKKAAKHPFSLIVPSDFRLLDNPEQCVHFFRSLLNKDNAYISNGEMLQLSLEMSDIKNIDFPAVMMLEAICEELSHSQCNVHGNSPRDKKSLQFLHNAGFYNMKYDIYGHRIFDPGNRQVIDIKMGEKLIQVKNLLEFITLMENTKKHLLADVEISIDNYVAILKEICGNSTEWCNNKRRNWTIAAKFEEQEVKFVALDLGQGIIKSLNKRFKDQMFEIFKKKPNHKVLKDVFNEYYGSKSKDPNRNQGLPFIRKCSEACLIKDLKVITNNAIIGFDGNNHDFTFANDNKGLKGTLYSWSIDINCLNCKLK